MTLVTHHHHHHHHRPMEHGIVARILTLPYLVDLLPGPVKMIATNGKLAAMGLLAVSIMLTGLIFPFWALSKLFIGEMGVYALLCGLIFLLGRGIIRMIAFPGASRKVAGDIENEFAKYSIRMIDISCTCLHEVATVLLSAVEDGGVVKNHPATLNQLPQLWGRAQNYRNRILAVFLDVLTYMQEDGNSLVLTTEASDGGANQHQTTTPPAGPFGPNFSRFGNNRLTGDIGSFGSLPTKAKLDGFELHKRLKIIVALMDELAVSAAPMFQSGRGGNGAIVVPDVVRTMATALKTAAIDLRDFSTSLGPRSHEEMMNNQREDSTDQFRRSLDNSSNGGPMDAVRAVTNNLGPMIDPLPQRSIFGLDVLRGCTLSRYQGATQFWVRRPTGGMIDVLRFPAANIKATPPTIRKSVLYCNPNAGMIEVSAGINFSGGNVPTVDKANSNNDSWVDFYTDLGFDVYVFNYAGYGRSYGPTGPAPTGDHAPGCCAKMWRILNSSLYSFQPTPDTLRADGIAVATHLMTAEGVQHLVIHGESIGGLSAAGAARYLSNSAVYRSKLSLLVCDRTFCNLEAIAQRLVGGWTGYAIRALAPFWNTDVAGDFIASSCPKILASDAADVIIAEAASLKSGVALWKEMKRGPSTQGIGWIPETPVHYRMADFENCCVNDTKFHPMKSLFRTNPPTWPQDKHMSSDEVFHFAACCRRIAKNAKLSAQRNRTTDAEEISSDIADFSRLSPVMQAWINLACCDGLTGSTLGIAVKRGYDATLTWLCACLVFGGQVVLDKAERRSGSTLPKPNVSDGDFDLRPEWYEMKEQEGTVVFPKPIPEVLKSLVAYCEIGDEVISTLSHEFQYVIGTLHYIVERLKDQSHRGSIIQSDAGTFLNLNCGHNNSFSLAEKEHFTSLLDGILNSPHTVV